MAAAALIAAPASADIVNLTVTGHVAPYTFNGTAIVSTPLIDNGTFGNAGDNLFGDAFVANWTVNTGCGACNYASGGTINTPDTVSPILSATLTINGVTVSFSVGLYGVIYNYHNISRNAAVTVNNGNFDAFEISVTAAPGSSAMNQFVNTFGGSFSGDINVPFTYVVNPLTDNIDHGGVGGAFSYGGLAGYLFPETFTLTNQTHPVPGPIVGAGIPGLLLLAGLTLLRRRAR